MTLTGGCELCCIGNARTALLWDSDDVSDKASTGPLLPCSGFGAMQLRGMAKNEVMMVLLLLVLVDGGAAGVGLRLGGTERS